MEDDADREATCPTCGARVVWQPCETCQVEGETLLIGVDHCAECGGDGGRFECPLGCEPPSVTDAGGGYSTAGGNDPFEVVSNPVNYADPRNWTPPPGTVREALEIVDFRVFPTHEAPRIPDEDVRSAFCASDHCPHGCNFWAREAANHLTRQSSELFIV